MMLHRETIAGRLLRFTSRIGAAVVRDMLPGGSGGRRARARGRRVAPRRHALRRQRAGSRRRRPGDPGGEDRGRRQARTALRRPSDRLPGIDRRAGSSTCTPIAIRSDRARCARLELPDPGMHDGRQRQLRHGIDRHCRVFLARLEPRRFERHERDPVGVPHGPVRERAMGGENRPPTPRGARADADARIDRAMARGLGACRPG